MTGPDMTGEEGIIQTYLAPLAKSHPGALGLLDDAAILTPPAGYDLVVTMDAVAAGVHFFPDDDPAAIGWKALAVNVSDLAAKGARPHAYLMSLAFPAAPTPEWLRAFTAGLHEAQRAFGLTLVGGDTDRRPGPLAITITAIGFIARGTMVKRGSAQAGDRIFVSGTLGDAALGLKLRARSGLSDAALQALDGAGRSFLLERYLRPQPRTALSEVVRAHARAAMDLSDGLAKDLGRMAAASAVSARIEGAQLPLSAPGAAILAADPGEFVSIVAGGDDYEILCAVAPRSAAAFSAEARSAGIAVTDIGCFGPGTGIKMIAADGSDVPLARTGYDHF